ncbi:MAG TPA: type II toxin-antitoxin system PemK/MazF family toxin [Chthonomonadales bacterium]|nr:type II toxin-antitoxin system PemK/MazF family toxin [Chthonomonadales bacterium]
MDRQGLPLGSEEPTIPDRTPCRGEIIRVRFDPVEGSEQGGERPALVISPDFINERAPVVLVAPLTSRKTERVYPFEALIEPPDGGIPQRSKVMLLHPRSVARDRIAGYYGAASAETMDRVEDALRVATGLDPTDELG